MRKYPRTNYVLELVLGTSSTYYDLTIPDVFKHVLEEELHAVSDSDWNSLFFKIGMYSGSKNHLEYAKHISESLPDIVLSKNTDQETAYKIKLSDRYISELSLMEYLYFGKLSRMIFIGILQSHKGVFGSASKMTAVKAIQIGSFALKHVFEKIDENPLMLQDFMAEYQKHAQSKWFLNFILSQRQLEYWQLRHCNEIVLCDYLNQMFLKYYNLNYL